MIKSIEIKNFRCFSGLDVKDCAPINVIVGDNGTGKTTLFEGVFLALCNNPQKGVLLRQNRGNDPSFRGNPTVIVEALYAEFFHRLNLDEGPRISLKGEGQETRSLRIIRGRGDVIVPKGSKDCC